MSNAWFRMYAEVLNDPKVQALDGDTFKVWVNLLCVTSHCDGHINFDDVSFYLRMSDKEALEYCKKLADKGLLDVTENGYKPHGWDNRQYKSDTSAERTKRYRERKKAEISDVTVTSHVTPPDTDTDTDTDTEKKVRVVGTRFSLVTPPVEWVQFCNTQRPDLNAGIVFDGFRDYWISKAGKDGTKLDWFATWRNWVRNQKTNGGKNEATSRNNPPAKSKWASEGERLVEKYNAQAYAAGEG